MSFTTRQVSLVHPPSRAYCCFPLSLPHRCTAVLRRAGGYSFNNYTLHAVSQLAMTVSADIPLISPQCQSFIPLQPFSSCTFFQFQVPLVAHVSTQASCCHHHINALRSCEREHKITTNSHLTAYFAVRDSAPLLSSWITPRLLLHYDILPVASAFCTSSYRRML